MNPNTTEQDSIEKLVQEKAAQLSEHVDSVRIFVTYHDGGKEITCGYTFGIGSHYAVRGQIHEWQIKKDEEERCNVRDQWKDQGE